MSVTAENVEMIVGTLTTIVSGATSTDDQVADNAGIISSTLSQATDLLMNGSFTIEDQVSLELYSLLVTGLLHILPPVVHGGCEWGCEWNCLLATCFYQR